MKWMKLRNYLAPLFMKEIDKVSEIYISNIIFTKHLKRFINRIKREL
jgi:predicted metallo-beta-lactamase superfamily hydrolase